MEKKNGIYGDTIPSLPDTAIRFEHGWLCGASAMCGYIYAALLAADRLKLKDVVKRTRLVEKTDITGKSTGTYCMKSEYYLNFRTAKQRDRAYDILDEGFRRCGETKYNIDGRSGIGIAKACRLNECGRWEYKVEHLSPYTIISDFNQKYAFDQGYGFRQHEFTKYLKGGKCR